MQLDREAACVEGDKLQQSRAGWHRDDIQWRRGSSLTSGLSYKFQEGARNSSAPPESRPASGTPSLTALDPAEAASGAVSPGAVVHSPGSSRSSCAGISATDRLRQPTASIEVGIGQSQRIRQYP